jgi:hypothetical protein
VGAVEDRIKRPALAGAVETLMIPQHEIDNLTMTITTAEDLAAEGHLAAGYGALLAGRQRAAESRAQGAEWGEELVRRWRLACENYVEAYGISLEEEEGGEAEKGTG